MSQSEPPPIIEMVGVRKIYQGLRPLRIARLRVRRGERFVLMGFDAGAAEAFVHLVTGASLADEGRILVAGRDTQSIATDTEWLESLDRFGIVTERAVLIDALPISANLALPMTLSIDPIPPEIEPRIVDLAEHVGLASHRLSAAASTLSPEERVRVHLARALALDPALLLLEHPTARLEPAAAAAIGKTLRRMSDERGTGWVALSADERFARAAGGTRLRLKAATGDLVEEGFWRRLL